MRTIANVRSAEQASEVTEAFIITVVQPIKPLEITCTLLELLERFTCILYDRTTSVVMVNDLKKELFSRGSLSMENIPPSQVMLQEALLQHANRALYQANIWTTSTQTMQTVPSPEGCGWSKTAKS
jgi:hypothetical protein